MDVYIAIGDFSQVDSFLHKNDEQKMNEIKKASKCLITYAQYGRMGYLRING